MSVVISMLRGVNLASTRRIKMEDLRAVYESLKLRDVRTYVQSGNVVFRSSEDDFARLIQRIEKGIERAFGFHSDVILRTTGEMRDVVARNPFALRRDVKPARLLVTFLAADPGEGVRTEVRRIKTNPEELYFEGRELYIYFPEGIGRSKLPTAAIEKICKTPSTARNWNSVTKLLELAEAMEGSAWRRARVQS